MFKYLVELLKSFFLEFRGARVHDVILGIEEPRLLKHEPTWSVRVSESSLKVSVLDLKEGEKRAVVREGCFQVKIGTGTLPLPTVATSMKSLLPLLDPPEVLREVVIAEPPLCKASELAARVLSKLSSPPLWKRRVRREVKVEREKIERALHVLQEMLEKEELKSVAFSGYFKNVPNGTIKIVGNDLIVEFSRDNPRFRDLVVFKVFTKNNKTSHVFIFLS